jgi:hypothetical protein
MDWVESKSVWGLSPEFAEIFVGREPFERLESSGEVVGFLRKSFKLTQNPRTKPLGS